MMTPEPIAAIAAVHPPVELMKFTLIYEGDLPPNSRRPLYASKVRNQIHDQLYDLWQSHVVLRQLARTARVHMTTAHVVAPKSPLLPDYNWPVPPLPEGSVDLCAPLRVDGVGASFLPIVRKSLYLACSIDVLILRHEEPQHLFDAGGDLDNRLKCFFDGLKIPNKEQAKAGESPTGDPLCVLLEDDKLISGFSVRSARLLGAGEKKRHAIHIIADVTVKVLRVMDENLCVGGDG